MSQDPRNFSAVESAIAHTSERGVKVASNALNDVPASGQLPAKRLAEVSIQYAEYVSYVEAVEHRTSFPGMT